MNPSLTSNILSFFLLLVCNVAAQDSFVDTTIDRLGTTQRLHCSNVSESLIYPNDSIPNAWMLPDLSVLTMPGGKHDFENEKWTLIVRNVSQNDLGLYHCMMITPSQDWFLVRLGLNANGPYYENQWEIYELNTIIGLCAAGGFMLIVLAIYLAYRLKPSFFVSCHRPNSIQPEVEENNTRNGIEIKESNGYNIELNQANSEIEENGGNDNKGFAEEKTKV